MAWTLLLPASAVVIALVTLAVGLRRVEHEAAALRGSLRRAGATAIAADEADRSAARLKERAIDTSRDATRRLTQRPRWWSRDHALGR